MRMVHTVRDDRGHDLEAHCDLDESSGGYRWYVELYNGTQIRGKFTIEVPPGVTMEEAISRRLQAEGIHARNSP